MYLMFAEIFYFVEEWSDVSELRDHNIERRDSNPDAWEEHEIKVGLFLTQVLKLKVYIIQ